MRAALLTPMPISIALNASRILCSFQSLYDVGRFVEVDAEVDVELDKQPDADRVITRSLRGLCSLICGSRQVLKITIR